MSHSVCHCPISDTVGSLGGYVQCYRSCCYGTLCTTTAQQHQYVDEALQLTPAAHCHSCHYNMCTCIWHIHHTQHVTQSTNNPTCRCTVTALNCPDDGWNKNVPQAQLATAAPICRTPRLSYFSVLLEANTPYVVAANYYADFSSYCPFVDANVQPPSHSPSLRSPTSSLSWSTMAANPATAAVLAQSECGKNQERCRLSQWKAQDQGVTEDEARPLLLLSTACWAAEAGISAGVKLPECICIPVPGPVTRF